MRPLPRLLLLTVLVVAVPADAKTTVIDDSGTLPYDAPLVLHWQQLSPRRPVNNRMTGTLTVRVKLSLEVDGTQMRQLYHVNFRFEMDEE